MTRQTADESLVPPTGFEPALPPCQKRTERGVLGHEGLRTPTAWYRLPGTPDRIRTGATALRGRRARPLHNGGEVDETLARGRRAAFAGVRRWGTRTRT